MVQKIYIYIPAGIGINFNAQHELIKVNSPGGDWRELPFPPPTSTDFDETSNQEMRDLVN